MKKLYAESGRKRINGAKGGGGGGGSSESPDSLHSTARAKVLDIISEGPIVGLVNGMQSVYLDGTPIQNSDGSVNFQNYSVDVRTGTIDQEFIPGFPAVERESAVGVQLTSDAPWVRQVQNPQLTAVRIRFGVPALQKSDPASGVFGYRVEYAIDLSVDGGSYAQVLSAAFDGKTTSLYERSHRIELPRAKAGWLVRVRRITPNQHSSLIADTVNIEAITEVIDRKLRYPMTALVGMTFDARSFSQVPVRSYKVRGLIVRVPSNYDVETRTYSGAWDGTFKLAWTNNPAWIFYDLLLNDRYGLGKTVDASMIDKWGLYEIARYCDVLVSDGKGGVEPRFTCNCVIQSAADAFKVLQDIASVFRGIAYWGPGAVVASADMPSDPVYVYTAANVIDGAFRYVGSERKTRYTVALVSYNDPTNQYKQAVEYVPDEDGIARYGVVKTQVTAFGCTSQAQAHRLGQWILLTSRYEAGTVSFQVGMDGVLVGPGQVIAIADPKKAGRRIGGRIRSVAGNVVTLDKAPTVAPGDRFTAILPSGVAQSRAVKSADGDVLVLVDRFDADPVSGAVWMLESDEIAAQLYRVVSVQESDDEGQIAYTITATKHEPGKYAAIDDGAQIQQRPITVVPPSVQAPPANVRISTYSVVDQGIAKTNMVIAWDAADKAVTYLPEWRKDNGDWVSVAQTGGLQVEIPGIYQGRYVARVRAQNVMNVTSLPAVSAETTLAGKTTPPPAVASLKAAGVVYGINLSWSFPADGTAGDTQRTEVWQSRTTNRADAIKLSDFAYPQASTSIQGLAPGQVFYFWARLVDRSGNVGSWFPATGPGVQGQPATDQSEYEKYFEGQIWHSALGDDLKKPIDAIPSIQKDVSSNATAIAKEVLDRASAIAAEAAARASAINAEASARAQALADEVLARNAAIAAEAAVRAAEIEQEVADRIAAIKKEIEDRQAALAAEASARTTAIAGEASARDAAIKAASDVQARELADQAAKLGASIASEQSARQAADSSLSSRIDTNTAAIGQNTSAIQAEQVARASAVDAEANQRELLATQLRGAYDGADLSKVTSGLIGQERDARVTQYESVVQQITQLQAGVGEQFDYAQIWYFTNGVDGWTAQSGTPTVTASWLRPPAVAKGYVQSPASLDINGDEYRQVRLRIRKTGNPGWYGFIGRNIAGTWSNLAIPEPDYDESGIAVVMLNEAWSGSVSQLRVYLALAPTAKDFFEIDWVAVGRPAPGASSAALTNEAMARATADTAETTARQQLSVKLTGLQDPSNAKLETLPSGLIVDERNARVAADSANASAISSLQVSVGQNAGAIQTESNTRATADAALSGRIDTVTATANANKADISSEASARASADSALGKRIDAVTADVGSNKAAITAEQQARADADSALGKRVDAVTATASANAAAITQEQSARADGDAANASSIAAVQAQTNAKNTTFRQSVTPVAKAVNDVWIDLGSTNLLRNSQDFTAGSWSKQRVSLVVAAAAAPDGAQTAQKLVEGTNTDSNAHYFDQVPAGLDTTGTYTRSIFVKAAERSCVFLYTYCAHNTGTYARVIFDAKTGKFSSMAVTNGVQSYAAVPLDGGWWRISQTVSFTTSDTAYIVRVGVAMDATTINYSGDGVSGIYLWGAQLEALAGAGRYIPTAASAVSTIGNNSLLVWDGSNWVLSQDIGLANNAAAIATEVDARVSADSALSSRIDSVTASAAANTAAITAEKTARADADGALSTRIDAVTATANGNKAAISSEASTRASADSALSNRIDSLGSTVAGNSAAISAEQSARASGDSALGKRIDSVTADVGANKAAIATEQQARADADTALGKRVDTVTATAAANAAAITQEQTARVTGDAANAESIALVQAQTNAKNATFRQSITPIARAVNDVWIDLGSTNLIRYSEDYTNGAWSKVRCSIVKDAIAGPFDGARAQKLVESTDNGEHYFDQYPSIDPTQPFTRSLYVKSGERAKLQIKVFCRNNTGTFGGVVFDADTGVFSGPSLSRGSHSYAATQLSEGWWRVVYTAQFTTADTSIILRTQAFNGSTTYQGDGTSGIYVWGQQLEALAGAGRYIPTADAAVSTVGNNNLLVWDGADWKLSQDIGLANNAAAISTEASARATADDALSSRIDTVSASAAANSAAITAEQKARADADSALSTRVDAVTSTANSNKSAIASEQTARTDADSALGKRIDSVTATANCNTAAIAAEQKARADADSALSNRIESVSAQINVPMAGDSNQAAGSTQVMAGVWSEQSARAEADMALAQQIESVTAQMQSGQADLFAGIQNEAQARVDADSAQASQIATISAKANDTEAAVQTVAQSYADLNGRVAASYQIKTQVTTDGKTYIAGIGVGIDNSSGVVESQVLVSASRFAVVDPNNGGSSIVPFVVQGGQVFLRQALIGAGWITNAMIGSYIQSDNYIAGRQGWRIDKNGFFEINASDGSGNRLVLDGSSVRVYDGNGVLRVRMGMW
nr:phage tail protein [Burkholderia pseudomultivorans]